MTSRKASQTAWVSGLAAGRSACRLAAAIDGRNRSPIKWASTSVSVRGAEGVAGFEQPLFERVAILDDAVVDDGDSCRTGPGAGGNFRRRAGRGWPSGCGRCRGCRRRVGLSKRREALVRSCPLSCARQRPRRHSTAMPRCRSRDIPNAASPSSRMGAAAFLPTYPMMPHIFFDRGLRGKRGLINQQSNASAKTAATNRNVWTVARNTRPHSGTIWRWPRYGALFGTLYPRNPRNPRFYLHPKIQSAACAKSSTTTARDILSGCSRSSSAP